MSLFKTVPPTIAIMVTRRCNMSCAHCSVESAPRVDTPDPSEKELLHIIRESAAAGVSAVQFTGGEPMMRQQLVVRLMKEANHLGMESGLTTNGFWGRKKSAARTVLKQLLRYGLRYLTVSYDQYHAQYMGPQPILNIADAARELGFTFNLNITRTACDKRLDEYAHVFGNLANVRMRLYDVQPVGRARNFDLSSLRTETEGFCNAAAQATFTEDGRVIGCNGPAYFDSCSSPRHIGDLKSSTVSDLLKRHAADPILETIRTFGPAGLRDELKKDNRFVSSFERPFAGQCDLCHYITGNADMVRHLQTALADPSHAALRAAKASMINAARQSGEMTREHVNGPGTARLIFERVTTGAWPVHTEQILGRADIDWNHLAQYLSGCGLANTLAPAATQDEIRRWAPPYFGETLQKRAMRDGLRELSHRETLDKIHQALTRLNLRGVLLKGAALYLLELANKTVLARIPGDIDLYIENPAAAAKLRQCLLEIGFAGNPDALRTGPHHLAPVRWRNSSVEIHTGIMPAFYGLPEKAMAADAQPLPGWQYFATLTPEDMILHEVIHSTSHLYSFGLKLAMDIFRIHRLTNRPIDWEQIVSRANSCRCPDAFWVPVIALHRGLPSLMPIPAPVISKSPRGKTFRRMCVVAYKRLFTATDNADQMNPFTRNGIFILLHRGALSRARYVVELGRGDAAESRRTAMLANGGQSWKRLPSHLRSAWHDLKTYRRATAGR